MWIMTLTGSASFWSNPTARMGCRVGSGRNRTQTFSGRTCGKGRYIESLLDVKLHTTTPAGCYSCSVTNANRFQERTPSRISLVSQVFMKKRHAYSSSSWNVYAHVRRVWGGHPWLVQESSLYSIYLHTVWATLSQFWNEILRTKGQQQDPTNHHDINNAESRPVYAHRVEAPLRDSAPNLEKYKVV